MSDTNKAETASDPNDGRLEIGLGSDAATAATYESGNKEPVNVKHTEDAGQGVEFDGEGGVKRTGLDGLADDADYEPEDDTGSDEEVTPEPEAGEPEGEPAEDLGDYDGSNAETVTKFNERYLTPDGLNMDALSNEVLTNFKAGNAKLNEGTYGWLKDTVGVSRETADRIIEGELALAQKNDDAVYELAGGKEVYQSKIEWAAKTYSPAQKARFNTAMKAGGDEAREQLELLNVRFDKSGTKAPAAATTTEGGFKGLQGRRPVSPTKTTSQSSGGASTGAKPYTDAEEHRKAQAEAMRSGDKKAIAAVEARLKASTFWRKQR